MDYERYLWAIDKRTSRRCFTGEHVPEEKLARLRELVDCYNGESGLSMRLVTGDTAPFDRGRASGMFQGTCGYLTMVGKASDRDRMEKEGYYGEMFVLEATLLGMGTCWVASSFDKDRSCVEVEEGEVLDLAIAFGIAKEELSMKERAIREVLGKRARKKEDVAPGAEAAPSWFTDAIDAVMRAPSTKNTRPFTFTFEHGEATVHTVGNHERVMVDLGIAKLHFEVGAGKGTWHLGDNVTFAMGG